MDTPKLTPERRKLAAIDMIEYYFSSSYTDWRYIKLLSIKKQMNEKYEFYKDIIAITGKENPESRIAQEITNGLYFDAIAECVQYIEDLFALIKASKQTEYFVKHIISYDAGQIRSFIKTYDLSKQNLGLCFHFPHDLSFKSEEDGESYNAGIKYLAGLLENIKKFFTDYEFFYVQYKHGLTLPMRPFGKVYSEEQIKSDKEGNIEPFLVAFDNFNLEIAGKKRNWTAAQGVFMPGFTDNVRFNISGLHNENNYLRFVFPPDQNLNIEKFVDAAKMIRFCLNIFIFNYYNEMQHKEGLKKFKLPKDYTKDIIVSCTHGTE